MWAWPRWEAGCSVGAGPEARGGRGHCGRGRGTFGLQRPGGVRVTWRPPCGIGAFWARDAFGAVGGGGRTLLVPLWGSGGSPEGERSPLGRFWRFWGSFQEKLRRPPQRGENMAASSAPSLPGMPRGPAASAYTSGYASAPLFPTLPVVPRAPPSLPVTPLPFRLHFPSCPSRRSRRRPRSRRGPARPAPARLGAAGDPGGELMSSGGRCGGTRRPTGARRGLPRPSAA